RVSKRQQSDDVAIGKGRVRTVIQRQPACWTRKVDRDLILADNGRGLDVENRIEGKGVGEVDVAPRQLVGVPAKGHLTAKQMNVSQQHRPVPRASQPYISVDFH